MKFADFRTMIDHLARDVPPEFRDGIVAIEVSPKAVPDPVRGGVYTMGECIPLEWSGNGADLQSRIVLYHGSFAALARPRAGEAEWRHEAWDTLANELRHHLEWRANVGALEAYDWATEQNFARDAGQPFDPVFYRSGEQLAAGGSEGGARGFKRKNGGGGRGDGGRVRGHVARAALSSAAAIGRSAAVVPDARRVAGAPRR
jgi:hypothetical protein